jgi:hypothetical protein
MTEDQPTQTGDLGEMPAAEIEPPEPNPGGPDAVPEDDDNVAADLDPSENPAVQEYPDPLKEAFSEEDDTTTEATRSDDGDAAGSAEEESPA